MAVNDGSKTYSYDVENRLTTTSAGTAYAYDTTNRRVFEQVGGTGTCTFWSPDGRRIYEYTLQPVYVNNPFPQGGGSWRAVATRVGTKVYFGGSSWARQGLVGLM